MLKYLETYAEPQVNQLDDLTFRYSHACVIPCFDEGNAFLQRNEQVFKSATTLLVVIINQPSGSPTNANNAALLRFIRTSFRCLWRSVDQALALFEYGEKSHLLFVDCFTAGRQLPIQQGVGLARKIGADIACELVQKGSITSPWIFTTDADATLPLDYFHAAAPISHAAALIFPYQHMRPADADQARAIKLYEFGLGYYVDRLRCAGSPYAFQTVGSTLAIHAEHYAKVRGFPRRNAGEDFYILNKLAKTGSVVSLEQPVIKLAARLSHRTPFGTGAALGQILALENMQRDYLFYHPEVFVLLRTVQKSFAEIWQRLGNARNTRSCIETVVADALGNEKITTVLHGMGIGSAVAHALSHSKTPEGFHRHLHNWFDAFKTLKFVHGLRDAYYPSVNMEELKRLAPEACIAMHCGQNLEDSH